MGLLQTYQNNVVRKQNEMNRLIEGKAKEQVKIASLSTKIQTALRQMKSSKTQSIIESKQKAIYKLNEDIAKIEKKMADFEMKIARKNKEIHTEQAKVSKEQQKEQQQQQQKQKQYEQEQQKKQERYQREQLMAFDSINTKVNEHSEAISELQQLPEKITVLFFAANPRDQQQLSLDEEVRTIKEMISKSKHRDVIDFRSCWAVRPGDILQYINQYQPTIVHFSGHGSSNDELVLMDKNSNTKLIPMNSIVQAMSVANDDLRLVFFNTCHSKNQASNVVQHIECAIGMNASITDDAAQAFSAQFYSSIGFGLSVDKSFKQAKAALLLEGIGEEGTPQLFMADDCLADETYIVASSIQ
jgi:hypothetical protein